MGGSGLWVSVGFVVFARVYINVNNIEGKN